MRRCKPIRYPRRRPTRAVLLRMYRALYAYYGDRKWWPADTPFEVMIGAILTQNTAWKNVEKAIGSLKAAGRLSLRRLLSYKPEVLAFLIKPAGYFNVKMRRLRNLLFCFQDRYNGKIFRMKKSPMDKVRNELLGVNGIGNETADSIILYALERPAFVVDTYTRRVFSRHRYLRGDEDYETIRQVFLKLLPRSTKLYNDYHAQIVEVGKEFCRTIPRCINCPLRKFL